MFNDEFYTRHSHGSSRFGDEDDVRQLLHGSNPIGISHGLIPRVQTNEPTSVLGGAGSGKLATFGSYALGDPAVQSFFVLDVGGQYMSVTWHYNLALGRKVYAINAQGVSSYPDINHPIHLWGILKDNAELFDNALEVAGFALTESDMDGENAWVGQGARRWIARMLTSIVRLEKKVTPKKLVEFIHRIDTDSDYLESWAELCQSLPNHEHSTFSEILIKKHTSEKEYGSIMGKIKTDLDWLSSETIADSISGDEDYLSYLGDPDKKVGVYYAIKGGTSQRMQSLTRMVVGIAQLHCVQANKGALPLFYLEESATCGRAAFIKKAVSEYRKFFQTILVYQSYGQLVHLFGQAGAQEILDSCGMQILLGGGIRDINSAKRIAEFIGKATIHVNKPMAQNEHAHKAEKSMMDAWLGDGDIFDAVFEYEYGVEQSLQQEHAGRDVIDPAELMRLRDQVLILAPGLGIKPILARKLPNYWENPRLAGRYAPDPLFPPIDRVSIPGRWWKKSVPFLRRPVPEHLKDWPNHINGQIAYVKGYKTF